MSPFQQLQVILYLAGTHVGEFVSKVKPKGTAPKHINHSFGAGSTGLLIIIGLFLLLAILVLLAVAVYFKKDKK